jgi:hypothetical protein
VKARLARTRELIARRAVALYKAGELGPVAVVFSAGSLSDRIARIQALQLLLDHDQQLLARATDERNQLARARIAPSGRACTAARRRRRCSRGARSWRRSGAHAARCSRTCGATGHASAPS